MTDVTVLRAARWADVDAGQVRTPGVVVIDGNRGGAEFFSRDATGLLHPDGPFMEIDP